MEHGGFHGITWLHGCVLQSPLIEPPIFGYKGAISWRAQSARSMTASILSQTPLHFSIQSHSVKQVARSTETLISKTWPKTTKEWTIQVVNVVDALISLPISPFRNKGVISSAARSVSGSQTLVLSPFQELPQQQKNHFAQG